MVMVFSTFKRILHKGGSFQCFTSSCSECSYAVRRNALLVCIIRRFFSCDNPNTSWCTETITKPQSEDAHFFVGPFCKALPKNAESVKALFRDYGLGDTDISRAAQTWPYILNLTTHNLLPKLKFLSSIGLTRSDLRAFIVRDPTILGGSLDNKLILCYNFLKNLPLPDHSIVQIIKRHSRILSVNTKTVLAPNIELLRKMSVPQSKIMTMLTYYSPSLAAVHGKFKWAVDKAVDLGLDPLKIAFVQGVHVICSISPQTWDQKTKFYWGFGLSDDEILSAVKKQPLFMSVSEKKIKRCMDFFVHELHWNPRAVAKYPLLLFFSLEERTIPRCRVVEVLRKNGLVQDILPRSYLGLSEEKFLDRFVDRFKDDFPELMQINTIGISSVSKDDSLVCP